MVNASFSTGGGGGGDSGSDTTTESQSAGSGAREHERQQNRRQSEIERQKLKAVRQTPASASSEASNSATQNAAARGALGSQTSPSNTGGDMQTQTHTSKRTQNADARGALGHETSSRDVGGDTQPATYRTRNANARGAFGHQQQTKSHGGNPEAYKTIQNQMNQGPQFQTPHPNKQTNLYNWTHKKGAVHDYVTNLEKRSENQVTPHTRMVANQEGLNARAQRERIFAQRANSGYEKLTHGQLPSKKEAGAMWFQGAEDVERATHDAGNAIENGSPTKGMGPSLTGKEHLGDIPGEVGAGIVGGLGDLVGAGAQYPVTASADSPLQADAMTGNVPKLIGDLGKQKQPDATDKSGETPTQAAGGEVNLLGTGMARQAKAAAEHPGATAAMFALPAGETASGVEGGLGDAGVTTPYRPSIDTFSVGDSKGVSIGVKRYSGKVEESKTAASVAKGTSGKIPIGKGTPDVPLNKAFGKEGHVPSELSPTETAILQKSFEKAGKPNEAEKIRALRDTQKQSQKSPIKPNEVTPMVSRVLESHQVPPEAAGDVVNLLKNEKAKLYGSLTQKAGAEQVGEPGLNRVPRDLDVGGVKSKSEFAQKAADTINKHSETPTVSLEGGTPTSVKTGGKLFDIHEAENPESSYGGRQLGREFGIWNEPDVTSKEGVKTTTLSHQTGRKGISSIEHISQEPRDLAGFDVGHLGPSHAGRLKDIPDFYIGERANAEALRLIGKRNAADAVESGSQRFVDAFGPDISNWAKREYEAAKQNGEATTQIIDFGKDENANTRGSKSPYGDRGSSSSPSPSPIGTAGMDWGSPSPGSSPEPKSSKPSPGRNQSPEPNSPGDHIQSPIWPPSPTPNPSPGPKSHRPSPGPFSPPSSPPPASSPKKPVGPDSRSPFPFFQEQRTTNNRRRKHERQQPKKKPEEPTHVGHYNLQFVNPITTGEQLLFGGINMQAGSREQSNSKTENPFGIDFTGFGGHD